MSMSDPIADMLTRMRNALQGKQARVDIPASKLKERVCAVLKQEGYIEEYKLVENEYEGVLQVTLKYEPNRKPVIQGIKRVSKPSLRVYVQCTDIRPVRSGLGISIMSTSKGVMTGKAARHSKLGGEVLCEVW